MQREGAEEQAGQAGTGPGLVAKRGRDACGDFYFVDCLILRFTLLRSSSRRSCPGLCSPRASPHIHASSHGSSLRRIAFWRSRLVVIEGSSV